jgi:hypothetical protein
MCPARAGGQDDMNDWDRPHPWEEEGTGQVGNHVRPGQTSHTSKGKAAGSWLGSHQAEQREL